MPDMHKHTHHKIPRSLGGTNVARNLIDLCPGCHDALHNAAYKLLSSKVPASQVDDSLTILYGKNVEAKKKCLELALIVRDATVKGQESGLGADHVLNITSSLRKTHKDLLVVRCKELKISQEHYIRTLILADLKNRFHITVDPVVENKTIKLLKKRGGS